MKKRGVKKGGGEIYNEPQWRQLDKIGERKEEKLRNQDHND